MKLLLLLILSLPGAAWGHADGVDFDPRPGALVPQDLVFRHAGQPVLLRSFLGSRPVALVFGYLHCKDLCSLVPKNAKEALDHSNRDYVPLFVSIDPRDERTTTAEKDGWVVLAGAAAAARLAGAVGFRYEQDAADYRHPAGFIVLTPEGRVSRYFTGVRFENGAVRDALSAAIAGETPGMLDRLLLVCFHGRVESSSGRTALAFLKIAFSVFGAGVGFLIWRNR